jgi:hypothetical protein
MQITGVAKVATRELRIRGTGALRTRASISFSIPLARATGAPCGRESLPFTFRSCWFPLVCPASERCLGKEVRSRNGRA